MRHSERGGALVEFAVIVPVALFFLLGILQMSFMLYTYHAVGNGARLGARWMALHGANCFNTGKDAAGNTLCPASNNAVQYYVLNQMPGLDNKNLTVTPSWNDPPTTWQSHPTGCSASHAGGCIATVSVDYQFKYLAGILGLPGQRKISSQSQFIVQGP